MGGTNVDGLQQVEAEYTVGKELCGVAAVGYLMRRLGLLEVRKNGYLQKAGTGGEKNRDQLGDRMCNGWLSFYFWDKFTEEVGSP